jgi:hypothetical protein
MSKKTNLDEWMAGVFDIEKEKPTGSFTIEEVMKKTGLTRGSVEARLNKRIQAGELKKGKFLRNGKMANYYLLTK